MTSPGSFRTTRWSMILSARAKGEPGSAEALAGLCEAYWYPLYVFVRRMGHGPDDARDHTQGYFLRLLEKDYLESVRPEAGRFRSFLLASMKHYLANARREAAALKRGGGQSLVSLDTHAAENRYRNEPVDDDTPDRAYERRWALAVLERARARLRKEFEAAGKQRQFTLLSGHLSGGGGGRSYAEIAAELETTEAAVKMSAARMRRQFGKTLREEIGDTVGDNAEIDAEVKHLLAVLR